MHFKRAPSEMFSTRAPQKELQLRSLDLPSFAGALLSISSTDFTQDSRTPKLYHTTLTIRPSPDSVLLTLAFQKPSAHVVIWNTTTSSVEASSLAPK
jgi:hypothetical protein